MDQRKKVLNEALIKNADETQRWETYQKEHMQAIENLENFSKKLSVDVMVPIGRKAFMPGKLIHTNEVFVAHYQGYFSQTSSFTAVKLCQHRLKLAEEHLKKLKTEHELWQNKLDKPYIDGAMPKRDEYELIEEYDEEKEKIWRQEHKKRLKEWKMHEREQRMRGSNFNSKDNPTDLTKLLEEAAIIEELKSEMETLRTENLTEDDMLQKLMSGQVSITEKKRISHKEVEKAMDDSAKTEQKTIALSNVCKKSDFQKDHPEWDNNNSRKNTDLSDAYNNGNLSDSSRTSESLEEMQLMEKQAEFLSPEDQVGFYKYQLQIINKKILTQPCKNMEEIEERVRLFQVRDRLEQILEELEVTDSNEKQDGGIEKRSDDNTSKKFLSKNRHISFALEDQTIEFCKKEKVKNMLPNSKSMHVGFHGKDVIRLDEPIIHENGLKDARADHLTILEKVEKNLNHVAETQSLHDSCLVNNITDEKRTLHIKFTHSKQENTALAKICSKESYNYPKTPADIYGMFSRINEKQIPLCDNNCPTDTKTPILKENDRSEAYTDLRAEFSKPGILKNGCVINSTQKENESIPHVIERETDKVENTSNRSAKDKKNAQRPKTPPITDEGQYMSAYAKVMGDIVEKITPDPLPTCEFIDAFAPKKRVSRFKQMQEEKRNSNNPKVHISTSN